MGLARGQGDQGAVPGAVPRGPARGIQGRGVFPRVGAAAQAELGQVIGVRAPQAREDGVQEAGWRLASVNVSIFPVRRNVGCQYAFVRAIIK